MGVMTKLESRSRVLEVELLALDLEKCGRCAGTLANIEAAVEQAAGRLESPVVEIRVKKTIVGTAAEAERLRFASSPTIRIDGRDIALETRESRCGDCSDLCGCGEGTECRVWSWRGEEHEVAPVALIEEALLRHLETPVETAPSRQDEPFVLPENLRRFYAARARNAAAAPAACCPEPELATCCPPAAKAECCPPAAASCGCS